MCFSATASFAAGAALSAVGAATLSQVRSKKEIPLASIPLVFAAQQATEGVVWISFGTPLINTVAAYAYTFFSHVLWPAFVPFAVFFVETDPVRKKILALLTLLGATLGMYLLYLVMLNPITVQVVNHSIAYCSVYPHPWANVTLYLVTTCVSCLVSSRKIINVFGLVLLASCAITEWFFIATFFSVWCFFAAILSAILLWYFWNNATDRVRTGRYARR